MEGFLLGQINSKNLVKKSKLTMLIVLLLGLYTGSAQELHIASGGTVYVSSGDALYVDNNVGINAAGNLTISSNASSSGSLLVTGSVTGNISYIRYIPDTNWHLVAPPVANQSIPTFVSDAGNSITTNGGNGNFAVAYYNNANSAGERWTYHNATPSAANQETLTNFVNGQGYSMNRTTAGAFTFTGSMTTLDVGVALITSSGGHYWSSIGNPYPSFLPANDNAAGTNVLGQNINILDPSFAGLYFWNGSAYEVINQTSAALHFSPGQAFMVRAKDESELFTFTESLQSHQSGTDNFYRNGNSTPNIVVHVSNGSQQKSTEIKYISNATTGLDVGYDAGTYENNTPSFSIDSHLVADSEGINFMLQCLPDNNYETMVIPLAIRANANTPLTFHVVASNLPQGIDVYLEDKEANIIEKISENPYEVTPDEALTGIGRFYLHTSSTALSVDDVASLEFINMYKTNNTTLRITGLASHSISRIRLYDITGKEVMNHKFISQNVKDISLPAQLATGIYIATLVSNSSTMTKKIIIE